MAAWTTFARFSSRIACSSTAYSVARLTSARMTPRRGLGA